MRCRREYRHRKTESVACSGDWDFVTANNMEGNVQISFKSNSGFVVIDKGVKAIDSSYGSLEGVVDFIAERTGYFKPTVAIAKGRVDVEDEVCFVY